MTQDFFINGDYHTHTVFSHGRGSVDDNIKAALGKGLSSIAMTDHGYGHILVGLSKRGFAKQYQEIINARIKYPEIEILLGVESNLLGLEGQTDLSADMMDKLDIYLCGFHKPCFGAKFSDNFKLFANAYKKYFVRPTKKMIDRNTQAYINAIKSNPIEIITHINYHLKVDTYAVAKVAAEYGTYIELSSRHLQCTDDDIRAMLKTDVGFIVNSDAHKPTNIGVWEAAEAAIKRLDIPRERIVNFGQQKPDFRFKKFKERQGIK